MDLATAQSALHPAGKGAERIADLFWWMAGGALLIWAAIIVFAFYVIRHSPRAHRARMSNIIIVGGGVIFPIVVLTGLLSYGLAMLPDLVAPAPAGSQRIEVTGYQWWWRVRYPREKGEFVELANEIVLPVGEPVEFLLDSADVIHAFWIPALGGKIDMIPGRRTRLTLEPVKTGTYRGACAEYCGGSHALMNFHVVVMERPAFERWLEQQAQPADEPADLAGQRGREVFLQHGCGACHRIRGTDADGVIAPDLTHFGSRHTIGAGLLPNTPDALRRWLLRTDILKPGVHMPAFSMMSAEELDSLVFFLTNLK